MSSQESQAPPSAWFDWNAVNKAFKKCSKTEIMKGLLIFWRNEQIVSSLEGEDTQVGGRHFPLSQDINPSCYSC